MPTNTLPYVLREIGVNWVGYKLGVRKLLGRGTVNNLSGNIGADVLDKGAKHPAFVRRTLSDLNLPGLYPGRRIIEMGPGGTILSGLNFILDGWEEYIGLDAFPSAVWSEYPQSVYKAAVESMDMETAAKAKRILSRSKEGQGPVFYFGENGLANKELLRKVEPGTADMIYSWGVLEHIEDPRDVFFRNHQLLKKGGVALHVIDPYPHTWRRFDNPYVFLTVPDFVWKMMYKDRGFINRHRSGSYLEWAKEAGFRVISSKGELADSRYLELKGEFLSRFKELADEDILTERMYLVLVKD